MFVKTTTTLLALLIALCARSATSDTISTDLDHRFTGSIQPFFKAYCLDCHSGEKPEGQFDLTTYSTVSAVVQRSSTSAWAM